MTQSLFPQFLWDKWSGVCFQKFCTNTISLISQEVRKQELWQQEFRLDENFKFWDKSINNLSKLFVKSKLKILLKWKLFQLFVLSGFFNFIKFSSNDATNCLAFKQCVNILKFCNRESPSICKPIKFPSRNRFEKIVHILLISDLEFKCCLWFDVLGLNKAILAKICYFIEAY